jgi:hypothetical protein
MPLMSSDPFSAPRKPRDFEFTILFIIPPSVPGSKRPRAAAGVDLPLADPRERLLRSESAMPELTRGYRQRIPKEFLLERGGPLQRSDSRSWRQLLEFNRRADHRRFKTAVAARQIDFRAQSRICQVATVQVNRYSTPAAAAVARWMASARAFIGRADLSRRRSARRSVAEEEKGSLLVSLRSAFCFWKHTSMPLMSSDPFSAPHQCP